MDLSGARCSKPGNHVTLPRDKLKKCTMQHAKQTIYKKLPPVKMIPTPMCTLALLDSTQLTFVYLRKAQMGQEIAEYYLKQY